MLKLNLNGKDAQGTPTHETTGLFFPQFAIVPGPLGQPGLMLIPGTGIPMRDYFAAHALSSIALGEMSSRETAEWAYRVADAMLITRQLPTPPKPQTGHPPVDLD